MIIVSLKGGLGNQMFQYAFGRKIALLNNTDLLLDLNWYGRKGKDTPRKYVLDSYNIKAKIASSSEISLLKGRDDKFHRILNRVSHLFLSPRSSSIIREKNNFFDSSMLNYFGDFYFDGYWSDFRYFNDIPSHIANEFSLKESFIPPKEDLNNEIKSSNSISVHLRRGDYANNASVTKHHGLLPLAYFDSSLHYISKLSVSPHFYVFSDDLEWTKANLTIPFPHTFVDSSPDGMESVDLKLMSSCKHNIISNSTFSWWAAWLNDNPSKIVIAPPNWSYLVPDTSKIIPPSWVINSF